MSRKPHPLHVVLISQDVTLLHEVSWTLEAVGYNVQASTDFDSEALWRRYAIADFIILDGRNIAEPTAAAFAHDSDNPQYRIFLYDPAKPTDFAAWYATGANDGLRAPVSRGELLARVRTGARYLEFERRLEARSPRCAVPGMFSRRGFLRKLRKLSSSAEHNSVQHGLLMTAIDWYPGIRRKNGETAVRCLVNTAARAITRAAGDNALSAYLGDGQFVTLLMGQSLATAKNVAEMLARDFGSRESHHESIPRPTLTSAVLSWTAGANTDTFLTEALEALRLAELSGGDCVGLQGDFSTELATWKNEMSNGNPFANVVAQDIMTPFPVVLRCDVQQSVLAEALRRSGVAVQPYVDREGRLAGVAAEKSTAAETHVVYPGGGDGVTLAMPETIRFDANFPDIYEAFSSRGCATLVVTADDRPLGYITFDGFLSMIDPIDSESFAPSDHLGDDLIGLIVPATMADAGAKEKEAAGV